jgi:tetratricopeptide (TPR) repeat protein
VRSRLGTVGSPAGAVAVVLALAGSAATLTWFWPARRMAAVADREQPLMPFASRTPSLGHLLGDRARSDRDDDPVADALERGVAADNMDDTDAAADAFEEAVRLAPENPEAHINLGLVYLRLQRPEDAMRELAAGTALGRRRRER